MPFKIIRNDITNITADAIVNTANPNPLIGSGTDSAIYKAAGKRELLKERRKIGHIERGHAVATPAFRLHADYIIHTVGPVWKGGDQGEEELLRSCYDNSLKLAHSLGCGSIAFPMISTGVYGFPKDLALKIILSVVTDFLTDHDMMIWLVVFERKAVRLSQRLFDKIESHIDDSYVEKRLVEEYLEEDSRAGKASLANRQFPGSFSERKSVAKGRKTDSKEETFSYHGTFSPSAGSKEPYAGPVNTVSREAEADQYLMEEAFALPSQAPRSLDDLMKQSEETFSQMLLRLIKEKGLTNAQAYKKANQDKKLFSKIKNNADYQPNKKTAMAFALALELSLDEAKDLLARAGYAFSPSSGFDKVIRYCIETKEFNIYEIEIILYDLGLGTLCNY